MALFISETGEIGDDTVLTWLIKARYGQAATLPEAYLSISTRVLPAVRFYDRVSTTVLNSYVGPTLKSYLENLTAKLQQTFDRLGKRGKLTEKDISTGLREVRLALLEADVNFKVVKDFISAVRERAIGHDVLESLTPGQQVIQIVRDELGQLMGGSENNQLDLGTRPPVPIMLCGLQGAGKTTTCGKLARWLVDQGIESLSLNPDTVVDTWLYMSGQQD